MSDTTIVAMPNDRTTNFDWGAIIGGALLSSALSFVLLAFGAAAGLASVSPYSWNNPSGTTLTMLGVAWVSVVIIGSALVGGYFTGRYRRPVGGASASVKERESRDGAHGLLMWALGLIVGIGIAYCVAAAAARGAATVAGSAATTAAAQNPTATAGIIDRMLRVGPGDPANPTRVENPHAEVARVLGGGAAKGEITAEDRDYAARIIATEAKIPPEEARKRVDAGIEQGKQAANTARKAAIGIAFLIGALSIISAAAAFWAAITGGREREENIWR